MVVNGRSIMSTPTIWNGHFTGMGCIGREWSFPPLGRYGTLSAIPSIFQGAYHHWHTSRLYISISISVFANAYTDVCLRNDPSSSYGTQTFAWEMTPHPVTVRNLHFVYSRPVDLCPPLGMLVWRIWCFKYSFQCCVVHVNSDRVLVRVRMEMGNSPYYSKLLQFSDTVVMLRGWQRATGIGHRMLLTSSQIGRVWLQYLILASVSREEVKRRIRKDWVRH